MILHLSVILFTSGGSLYDVTSCLTETPLRQRPSGQRPPPSWTETPRIETPGQRPPGQRHPSLDGESPGQRNPPVRYGKERVSRVKSWRYASYWNAFLLRMYFLMRNPV